MAHRPSLSCSLPISCTSHPCLNDMPQGHWAHACIPMHTASPSTPQGLSFSVCPSQPVPDTTITAPEITQVLSPLGSLSWTSKLPELGWLSHCYVRRIPCVECPSQHTTYYIDVVEFCACLYLYSLSSSRRARPCISRHVPRGLAQSVHPIITGWIEPVRWVPQYCNWNTVSWVTRISQMGCS